MLQIYLYPQCDIGGRWSDATSDYMTAQTPCSLQPAQVTDWTRIVLFKYLSLVKVKIKPKHNHQVGFRVYQLSFSCWETLHNAVAS